MSYLYTKASVKSFNPYQKYFSRIFFSFSYLTRLGPRLKLINLVCTKNLPYNKGLKTKFRFRRKKVKAIKLF